MWFSWSWRSKSEDLAYTQGLLWRHKHKSCIIFNNKLSEAQFIKVCSALNLQHKYSLKLAEHIYTVYIHSFQGVYGTVCTSLFGWTKKEDEQGPRMPPFKDIFLVFRYYKAFFDINLKPNKTRCEKIDLLPQLCIKNISPSPNQRKI